MTTDDLHPLAQDYLRRLRQAGRHLPADRLGELSAEIEGHLADAIEPGASDDEALAALHRLGPPEDVVEAEQPPVTVPADRRGKREWGAVILLPLGGFAFGVGWLVGLVLLWSSRLWTTRDKLIGTLIVPGGIASTVIVAVLVATKRTCVTSQSGVGNGPLGPPVTHCTPGASGAMTALQIALIVFFIVGPIVTAVYLARRARPRRALAAV